VTVSYTRLLLTWLLLAVLMPLNGALREFGFKRWMPDGSAEVLSVVTGIVVILATTRLLFRIPADTPTATLLLQSAILVALTVTYEFAIGLRGGQSLREIAGAYAFWRGETWLLILVTIALTPFLWRGRV
jgi:hypothetical protein